MKVKIVPLIGGLILSVLALNSSALPLWAADDNDSDPVVQILNGKTPGTLEIKAKHAIQLAPELGVERLDKDGTFVPLLGLDLGTMRLVTVCGQKLGKSVTVDEKGLRPVPWSGMSCSSQCNHTCDKNTPLIGHFRFVVKTFDGKSKFVGPAFELTEKNNPGWNR